jgi:magnesium transporter
MSDSAEATSLKTGLSPGMLIYTGETPEEAVTISVVDYNKDTFKESTIESIEELLPYRGAGTVTWVNIDGIHDVGLIEAIGKHFDIHPLVLEDILHSKQRSKIEDYDDYLFIVLKDLYLDEKDITVRQEQISIIIMEGFVFTFTERQRNLFSPINRRIAGGNGRIRGRGSDYLAYAIIDTIVDHYFVFQDSLDAILDDIEEQLLTNPTKQTLNDIQSLKREIIFVKRNVTPVREMLAMLLRSESPLILESSDIYYRDVYDHAIRFIETMESYRELITGMLDIYLSSISNKMNEVMKVLTIFASIFIPLTFIAGIYGMNFEYMPELKWRLAYPLLWVIFILITGLLVLYFKRKKWL